MDGILLWNTSNGRVENCVFLNCSTAVEVGDDTYKATIPGQPAGATVRFVIYARDGVGNWAVSGVYSYTVAKKAVAEKPSWPTIPGLPEEIAGIPTIFVVGGAVAVVIIAGAAAALTRGRRPTPLPPFPPP